MAFSSRFIASRIAMQDDPGDLLPVRTVGLRVEKAQTSDVARHVEVADNAIYIKGSKGPQLKTLVAAKGGNRREALFPAL
jgi:hypothetical protein